MEAFIPLLKQYGYFILFPLAAIEGPAISLLVGFLIYLGYFHFLPAYGVLILGDLIPDTIYYYIGRFGNRKKITEKYGKNFKLLHQNFGLIEKLWHDHGRKTMFFSKLAYGLSTPFLMSAGLVGMPLGRFVAYALPVTLFQYAVFLTLGFLLGHSYQLAAPYIKYVGITIGVFLLVLILIYAFFVKYARKQISQMESEEIGNDPSASGSPS